MFLKNDLSPERALKTAPDDEAFWSTVRGMMKPMYTHTQLVNTRRGAAPLKVRERVRELVDLSLAYELDEHEPFRELKESGSSLRVRRMIGDYFGADADEIAVNRNAMEGIATVFNGLELKPGDEVVATNFCYDSNLAILRQRAARDGIIVKLAELPFGPASDEAIIEAFLAQISARTRLITFPHIVSRIGLVLPAQKLGRLARERQIFTLVDGAHSAGHIPVNLTELGCDGFATCLHKWMFGPRGTGFLHIRKEKIAEVWPLWASWSNKPVDSIEKFEEVGSVFKALPASIPDAFDFNSEIGQDEKSARLRYMRDRWMFPLSQHPRVRLLTDPLAEPGTGFGAFTVEDMEPKAFRQALFDAAGINVLAFAMEEDSGLTGIHVSPSLSNSIEEVDRFVAAALEILDRK